jgi:prefoldin subunit 5
MLKNRVDYKDRGADYYNEQHKEQAIKRLEKQAKRLGLRLEPAEAALV